MSRREQDRASRAAWPPVANRRLLLASSASLALAAARCGAAGQGPKSALSLPPATLTYLGRGSTTDQEMWQGLMTSFERQRAPLKVQMDWTAGDAFGIQEKIIAQTAAGTPPDAFWGHVYTNPDLAAQGALADLNPLVRKDRGFRLEDYYPTPVEDFRVKGVLHGLPLEFTTIVLFYNKDRLAREGLAAPDKSWTWDKLLTAARTLTRGEGAGRQYGVTGYTGWAQTLMLLWQNRAEFLNKDRTACVIDSGPALEAYQWAQDLIHRHRVLQSPLDVAAEGAVSLVNGRVAMAPDIQAGAIALRRSAQFDWDVAHVPQGKARATRTASAGYVVHKATKYPEQAWELIKFLVGEEAMRAYQQHGLGIPPLKRAAESTIFLDPTTKPASKRVILDALTYAHAEPVTQRWRFVVAAFNEQFAPVWQGKRTVREAAAEAKRAVDDVLAGRRTS